MATGGNDPDCVSIWGDFVGSDDECEVEDACEPIERYEEGLYYPVCIGEVLVNRYCVKHKLGHGGFSTVWMAYDMLSNDDVALKIMSPGPSGEREYTAQNMIANINSANVLYGLAPFKSGTTIATKYKYLGRPRKMPIPTSRPIWKDGQLVMPIVPHNTLVQETITLADFGLAVKSGTSVGCKVQSPAIYCAPERIHGIDPSFASDMWSYICIFAELYLGFPLFYGSTCSSVVEFMVKSLGPLPLSWKDSYEGGGQYDESWYNQNRQPDPHQTLEAKIKRALYDISPVEQQLVLSILQRGLSYLPEHRFSAGQLLEDASFKELMAIYRL
ncbi:CMGC protein kinase [Fusarium austroafricanum]|uniref:CMGC protein kinase n=1 Tax=Fusarium austroafricanum TaxID=2364996 RepID=A0A8H4KV53_9HYPO|nr:CMGC protein kinase [Fusarium austroafricanum]